MEWAWPRAMWMRFWKAGSTPAPMWPCGSTTACCWAWTANRALVRWWVCKRWTWRLNAWPRMGRVFFRWPAPTTWGALVTLPKWRWRADGLRCTLSACHRARMWRRLVAAMGALAPTPAALASPLAWTTRCANPLCWTLPPAAWPKARCAWPTTKGAASNPAP